MAEARPTAAARSTDTFRCSFPAIPGTTPFRLDRATPRPVMRGPQTAKVVRRERRGDHHRPVRPREGAVPLGPRSATRTRTAPAGSGSPQIWAGASWGGIYIPRIGQEVVVEFLDGDPDRPIITGCVYNATTTVPVHAARQQDALDDQDQLLHRRQRLQRAALRGQGGLGGGLLPGAEGLQQGRAEQRDGGDHAGHHDHRGQGNRTITVSTGNNTITVTQGNNSTTVSQGNDSLTVSHGQPFDHGHRRQQHDQRRPVDPARRSARTASPSTAPAISITCGPDLSSRRRRARCRQWRAGDDAAGRRRSPSTDGQASSRHCSNANTRRRRRGPGRDGGRPGMRSRRRRPSARLLSADPRQSVEADHRRDRPPVAEQINLSCTTRSSSGSKQPGAACISWSTASRPTAR